MPFQIDQNQIIYEQNGRILAEITFPAFSPGVVNINHTFVDVSLRGLGVAGHMMERVALALRATNRKAVATCSFAKKWFAWHPAYQDVIRP